MSDAPTKGTSTADHESSPPTGAPSTADPNDERVREAILAAAHLDARRAPAFDSTWAAAGQRAKRRRSLAPIVAAGSALAVAAAVALVVSRLPEAAPPSSRADRSPITVPAPRPGADARTLPPAPAPLDFLLDVPTSAALASPVSKDW